MRALVSKPDVLMLDEPTNHLDVVAIEWLEGLLKGFLGAVLFVTHDRAFLRSVSTRILDLDRGKLASYPGDFDRYQMLKQADLDAEANAWSEFDKKLALEEAWIRQGIKAPTRNEGRVRALETARRAKGARERTGNARITVQQADAWAASDRSPRARLAGLDRAIVDGLDLSAQWRPPRDHRPQRLR